MTDGDLASALAVTADMGRLILAASLVLSLVGAAAVSPWLALFVLSLAGSAWMFATAFDDWAGDWRGVWHRIDPVGYTRGEYAEARWTP